jgi:hypothetical protein
MFDLCVNGGEKGADAMWLDVASRNGHKTAVYSFGDRIFSASSTALANAMTEVRTRTRPGVRTLAHDYSARIEMMIEASHPKSLYFVFNGSKLSGGTAETVRAFGAKVPNAPMFGMDTATGAWYSFGDGEQVPMRCPPPPIGVWLSAGPSRVENSVKTKDALDRMMGERTTTAASARPKTASAHQSARPTTASARPSARPKTAKVSGSRR